MADKWVDVKDEWVDVKEPTKDKWVDVPETKKDQWVDVEDKPKNQWVDVEEKPIDLIKNKLAQYREDVKQHPIKNALTPFAFRKEMWQPVTETVGLGKPSEFIDKQSVFQHKEGERLNPATWREFAKITAGQTADIYTTPGTHVIGPLFKAVGGVIGGIKVGSTTLGRILQKVSKGSGFKARVAELQRYDDWLKQYSPLSSRGESEAGKIAVNKLIQALRGAKSVRGKQDKLHSIERSRRAGKISGIGGKSQGEAGFHEQLGALKGELPKADFEGLRGKLTQLDIDELFNMVEKNSTLLPYEKITTKQGLAKLLGVEGGSVPTKGELSFLSEVFPEEFISTVLSKRTLLQKFGTGAAELLNIPRALMASADLSAPLRQGIFLVGRPKQTFPAFGNMFKYFFSEKAYKGLINDIKARPTYPLMRRAGLPLTDLGKGLAQREEAFMSQLAEKIPGGIGKVVRASDRAYTGFLDKLRADVFDDMIKSAQKLKLPMTDNLLNSVGRFVGSATGRGALPNALKDSAVALNTAFFSPKLMASRINLLNPVFYAKLHPFARKEALKSLFTFAGVGTSVLSLAKMSGASVSTDPRNADFGKIKVGNTRYDIWGGFQQYVRTAAQMITGEVISSGTGVKKVAGENYKSLTRKDILQRSIEMKAAPVASLIKTMLEGRSMGKQTVDLQAELVSRITPMVIQDMWDMKEELGIREVFRVVPAIFGVGVQTYSPSARGVVSAMHSVKTSVNEMMRQGRVDEAKQLWNNNLEFLTQGTVLSPYQTIINTLKRFQKDMLKNPNIPKEQKKNAKDIYDTNIKRYETLMDETFSHLKSLRKGTR